MGSGRAGWDLEGAGTNGKSVVGCSRSACCARHGARQRVGRASWGLEVVRSAAQLLTIFSACPIALRMYSFRAIELLFLLQRLADAHQSGWPYSLCRPQEGTGCSAPVPALLQEAAHVPYLWARPSSIFAFTRERCLSQVSPYRTDLWKKKHFQQVLQFERKAFCKVF
jgi:hypothetical protein